MIKKSTYKTRKLRHKTPKKSSRISRMLATGSVYGDVVVNAKTASNKTKTFRFSVLTESQQRKERNNAYRFFSID